MRLTLRTLLAYMDDILEPSHAKEIGARVSENNVASSLIRRIRDVMRRRRIGSPEVAGPGSSPDANLVAEYLDNTLEPSVVADVEKVCLDSDTHLAEVAACHQILTIVLGEPVTVRPELRERMYALGAPADGTPIDASSVLSAAPPAAPVTPVAPPRPVVPEYLKRPPVLKRVGPWLVIAILLAAWVGFIVSDEAMRPRWLSRFFPASSSKEGDSRTLAQVDRGEKSRDGGREAATDTTPKTKADESGAEAVDALAATERNSTNTAAPEAPADDSSSVVTDASGSAVSDAAQAVAEDANPTTPPAEVTTTETTPPEPPQPNADLVEAVTAATTPDAPAPAAQPATPAPGVLYTASEGVLLCRPAGQAEWTVLPRRALLHPGDEVACPEPYVAEFSVTPPGATTAIADVILAGGGRAKMLASVPDTAVEFELNRGRLGFVRSSDEGAGKVSVGVTAGGNRTVFQLEKPETRCGLLVALPQPDGPPPHANPPAIVGTLFVVSGAVSFTNRSGTDVVAEAAPEWIEWTNPQATTYSALGTIPMWLDPDARPTASTRSYARSFEPEFGLDQPVRSSIAPVLDDRRPQISKLAAQTLALVDDVPDLILALSAEHEETRLAAIVGLREWVPQSPENSDILAAEVARGFREDEAETVLKLIWGLTPDEARQQATALQVVEWMGSMNVAIRELAFFQVHRITGKDLGYRPVNPEGQREAALARWRDHVKKHNGLIAP